MSQTQQMQFENAYSFLMGKLESELPPYLHYHNAQHTKDVLDATERIATAEGASGDELTILKTAALFHDSGFLETYSDHEEISCEMAKKWLPQFGYNKEEIDRICHLILATKIPQTPENKLAQILCDADLYYLGTNKYFLNSDKLYKELHEAGFVKNREEWRNEEIKFVEGHHYFTKIAQKKLNAGLKETLSQLRLREIKQKSETKNYLIYDWISDAMFIVVGAILAAFALKGFLVPNGFFDGGVTGISLLIHELYNFDISYVIMLANLPFIIICVYAINVQYALKTFFCILLLGFCLYYFPHFSVTSDKLLVAIFGGFFLGAGIGLTMRAGCAIDGIEILALYTWKKTSFTITEIILAINILIFGIAAFRFGIEVALYSMLTYFTATKTVDYVVEGLEAYVGVTIISGKSEIIKDRLVNEMGRGITIYKGERGYLPGKFDLHADCDIIFTVITRLEIRKLKNLVSEIDPRSFVFASTIKEASGGIIKRRHIH
ncbi:MAG: YitT family protein [Ginsengibacter sp.]